MVMKITFWIPNLSGTATTSERIAQCIRTGKAGEFRITDDDGHIRIMYDSPTDRQQSDFVLTIAICDEQGLCDLTCNLDASLPTMFMANSAWNAFRSVVDGCEGTICDCTGLRDPFTRFQPSAPNISIHIQSDDPFINIVNRLIQSVEDVSDTMNHLWSSTFEIDDVQDSMDVASRSLANAQSNQLYFESFVRLYRDRFDKDLLTNKEQEMTLRMQKVLIAYNAISVQQRDRYDKQQDEYNRLQDRNNRTLELMSLCALIVSALALILNLVKRF